MCADRKVSVKSNIRKIGIIIIDGKVKDDAASRIIVLVHVIICTYSTRNVLSSVLRMLINYI